MHLLTAGPASNYARRIYILSTISIDIELLNQGQGNINAVLKDDSIGVNQDNNQPEQKIFSTDKSKLKYTYAVTFRGQIR